MAAYHLIVHNPFGSYGKGAHITDPAEVQRVLDGAGRDNVLRIAPIADAPPADTTAPSHGEGAPA